MRHRITRALGATLITTTLALSAVACGDDSGSAASTEVSATEHNDADVAFASEMLQHHAQALAMVDLTLGRTVGPEVQQLAEQIREAQAVEIETFADWLTQWGEEIPATVRDHANAHAGTEGMADMDDMPGMMSADQMTSLEDAPDSSFETMWLEMMIEHHEGALEMAEAQQENGQYEATVDLAGQITESQTAEIETMEGLLDS